MVSMRALRCGRFGAVLVMTLAWGCSDSQNGSGSDESSSGLPCEGSPVDCRLAFSGDYTGTFEGADTGTLTFYVNPIGGIDGKLMGSKLGSPAITGQVNEFGKIEFSTADGAAFTGQFKADHSFSGTWKGAPGTGTFTGEGAIYLMDGPLSIFRMKNHWFLTAAYMLPEPIGIGKPQLVLRYQQAANGDTDDKASIMEVAGAYVIKDYFAKLMVGYQRTKFEYASPKADVIGNAIQIGFQVQQ